MKTGTGRLLPWIAVDFDHTLVEIDTPIPGAKQAMEQLQALGYSIMIHSCNNREWIQKVLRANDIPYDYIWDPSEDKGKPVCIAYIDDRGIGFTGDWSKVISDILNMEQRREAIHNVNAETEARKE